MLSIKYGLRFLMVFYILYMHIKHKTRGADCVKMTVQALWEYMQVSRTWDAPDLLVLGHAAPDADALVSALFEAWRRYLAEGTKAVSVMQAHSVPREVAELLGDVVALLPTQEDLARWPQVPLVLTDHSHAPDKQDRVVAVIDHHRPQPGVDLSLVETCIQPVGATTTLIALRLREQGMQPDRDVARMLLGAILLDTEGLSPTKTKPEDTQAVTWLCERAAMQPDAYFPLLREALLSETEPSVLYRRDYRQYTDAQGAPVLGFAILKVWEDTVPDIQTVRALLQQDVAAGCPVCVAKISSYTAAGPQEEHYLAAGAAQLVETVLETVCAVAGPLAQRRAADWVFLPAEAGRPGRKTLYPRLLERLAEKK